MANLFRMSVGGGGTDIEPYIVNVTLNEDFAGQTVTMSQSGQTTMSKTCPSSGTYTVEFKPMYSGIWSIESTTIDGKASRTEVNLAAWGTYNAELTSGFDYDSWLSSGRVTKTFSSLDDVLEDEQTLRQLFTVHDSVDYLVSDCDEDTATTIFTNDLCAKWINLRDYALDTFYANTTFKSIMDTVDKYGYGEWALIDNVWQPKGTVPVMISNTAPYGEAIRSTYTGSSGEDAWLVFDGKNTGYWASAHNQATNSWIGYKFTNPVCIRSVFLSNIGVETNYGVGNFVVEASITGNTNDWVTLTDTIEHSTAVGSEVYYSFENDDYYRMYRVRFITVGSTSYAEVGRLQFYGRTLNITVPTMTSDTAPYGIASDVGGAGPSFSPYMAFNKNSGNQWCGNSGTESRKLIYNFEKPIKVLMAMVYAKSQTYQAVQSVTIKYSDDGNIWVDCSSNESITLGSYLYVNCTTNGSHKYYCMDFGQATSYILYADFYGLDYSEREFESNTTVDFIYDHGVEVKSVTKTSTSVLADVDTTSSNLLRATEGIYARTSDTIKCGSGSATITTTMIPYNCYLDISSVNGTNSTGFSSVANTSDIACWIE